MLHCKFTVTHCIILHFLKFSAWWFKMCLRVKARKHVKNIPALRAKGLHRKSLNTKARSAFVIPSCWKRFLNFRAWCFQIWQNISCDSKISTVWWLIFNNCRTLEMLFLLVVLLMLNWWFVFLFVVLLVLYVRGFCWCCTVPVN